MNYEFNLLHHVGVRSSQKSACGGGGDSGGARRGRQYPLGPTGRGVLSTIYLIPRECRPTHQIPVQCCASAHCWINAGESYTTLAQHWTSKHDKLKQCLRHWPNIKTTLFQCIVFAGNPSLGLLYTSRKHVAFTQSVSMLTHSLRRWPDIETTLGDFTEFYDCCMSVTMWVTLPIPDFQHQITR